MPASLNLRHLEALIAIAREGNFTRAAQALHISQPSLTVQIRQLEEALGVRLLDRNTRSVRLTQIGRELTPVIERLVREVDAVVLNARDLATGNRGLVTVAALPSISSTILPRIIGKFREESPGVSVMLRDVVAQRVLAMVKNEEADFGIGSFPDAEPDIHITPLFTDRMRVVFAPGSPLEKQRAISLKQLTGLPMILMDRQSSVRSLVNRAFESIGHFPLPAYEVTYMSTAVGMVKAGLGIGFLPSSALEVEELRGVRSRILHHPGLTRKIVVARSAARSLSPAAAGFIRTLTAFCKTLNHS
ncbi:MAG TPA: LysR family transcriptional regulator [Bryobacteraceae bacterium]|nr:LysR family transcriptional regulator [Bryobacteraceae bacterium]HWB99069.1 LysR family transcriptional regulator [Bryobacteraceae bacterium]